MKNIPMFKLKLSQITYEQGKKTDLKILQLFKHNILYNQSNHSVILFIFINSLDFRVDETYS